MNLAPGEPGDLVFETRETDFANQNRMILGFSRGGGRRLCLKHVCVSRVSKASSVNPVVTQHIVVAAESTLLWERVWMPATYDSFPGLPASRVAGMFAASRTVPTGRCQATWRQTSWRQLDNKLAPKRPARVCRPTIPQGMRAVSVAVNDVVGVAGVRDSRDDGRCSCDRKKSKMEAAARTPITRTILENVKGCSRPVRKIEQDREGKPQTVPVITPCSFSPKTREGWRWPAPKENSAGTAHDGGHQEGWATFDPWKPICFPAGRPRRRARPRSRS